MGEEANRFCYRGWCKLVTVRKPPFLSLGGLVPAFERRITNYIQEEQKGSIIDKMNPKRHSEDMHQTT